MRLELEGRIQNRRCISQILTLLDANGFGLTIGAIQAWEMTCFATHQPIQGQPLVKEKAPPQSNSFRRDGIVGGSH